MPSMRLFLLCAALPLALCACVAAPPAAPLAVTLAPGQHADVGGGARLAYDSYSDSRCPKTVWCIWAGELTYRFTLSTPAGASEAFALTLPNTSYVSRTLAPGTRIDIDPASVPPPAPARGSAAAQYVLTLRVSRP